MDNTSASNEEVMSDTEVNTDLTSPESGIVFDDILDFDALKNKIQTNVNDSGNTLPESENPSEMFLQPAEAPIEPVVLPDVQVETSVKKYVIHVDPENVSYMEHLTINERRRVINKILKEQSFLTEEELKSAKARKRVVHFFLAIMTFVIAFPIFFLTINTAAQMTMKSYITSKSNFSKLYKEHGKIQVR